MSGHTEWNYELLVLQGLDRMGAWAGAKIPGDGVM